MNTDPHFGNRPSVFDYLLRLFPDATVIDDRTDEPATGDAE